ncbi:MAG: hypothetical protein ACT4P8_15765 [Betaproteobacteria bacterium]
MEKTPIKGRKIGRPRANPLPRKEQMRVAKRAQRQRDRASGLALCQVKLPREIAERLRHAVAIPGFDAELGKFLEEAVVEVRKFPNLQLLAWNRVDPFITERDAFGLYERNWKFVDTKNMTDGERRLIQRLTEKWGRGVLNA